MRGLLLAGSLARGTARADSDLDLLVVTGEQATDGGWRSADRALPVDFLVRTPGEWRARFARTGPATSPGDTRSSTWEPSKGTWMT